MWMLRPERRENLRPVARQLCLADTADLAQLGQRGRARGRDLAQRRIVKYHIRGHALFPGGRRPPGAKLLKYRRGFAGQAGAARFIRRLASPFPPLRPLCRLRLAAQQDLVLPAQYPSACAGKRQRAVVTLDGEQPVGKQLAYHAAPLGLAQIRADAEHRHPVVSMLNDLGRFLAEQDVDDLPRAEFLAALAL